MDRKHVRFMVSNARLRVPLDGPVPRAVVLPSCPTETFLRQWQPETMRGLASLRSSPTSGLLTQASPLSALTKRMVTRQKPES